MRQPKFHDHHNLMVMGNTIEDILLAQNELLAMQGGYLVVSDQQVMATCPLPIGGILSQAPIEQLGASLQKVRQAMQALGYQNMNEIMSFSTLSLPVSPAIKVTDFGMMDTKSQRFYPLVFPEDGVLCMKTLIKMHILTMDEQFSEIKAGYLVIEEDTIVELAPMTTLDEKRMAVNQVIDGQNGILMPDD